MSAWKKHFKKFSIPIGQILLTPRDTELKISSKNAKQTVSKLISSWMSCPLLMKTIAQQQMKLSFGDNDLLAAKVAKLIGADLLIVLSTVDGLFTRRRTLKQES